MPEQDQPNPVQQGTSALGENPGGIHEEDETVRAGQVQGATGKFAATEPGDADLQGDNAMTPNDEPVPGGERSAPPPGPPDEPEH
jgi:hypothetical protein